MIIGAGLSGLAAATECVRLGLEPVVLEARGRVGGRTLNHRLPNGNVVEMGGQWIGPGQDQIAETASRLGIETFPTYDTGRKVFLYRGRRSTYRGVTPVSNPIGMADLGQALTRLQRMARTVSPEKPWTAVKAALWDSQTLGSWMRRNTLTAYARGGLTTWAHAVFASDPGELSLLHALAHAAAHRGVFALAATTGGAQQNRIVGGSQRISEVLADGLGDRVVLNSPAEAIQQDDDGVVVRSSAAEVTAGRVVVAMSPAMSARLSYQPPLAAARDELTQRMAMGTIAKIIAVYPTPFWRSQGLSGQGTGDQGPLTFVFDNSPPEGSPGVLVGFAAGSNARTFAQMTDSERRTASLDCFVSWFGAAAARPVEYHEKLWNEDEFARGGYFGCMAPGAWTTVGDALTAPAGRIHWAGSESAGWCMGSMDGALRAGIRAAREAAADLQPSRRSLPVDAGAR